MRIAKAMKLIARTKGKISNISNRIEKCVSCNIENDYIENFNDLIETRIDLIRELINLKNKVMATNIKHNMFDKILILSELKNEIELYKSLNIKQGLVSINYSETKAEYKTQFTISEKNEKINKLQDMINDITDELDIFNASTDLV